MCYHWENPRWKCHPSVNLWIPLHWGLSREWKSGGYLENGNSIVWVNTPSARVRWWFNLGTHCWWSRIGVSTVAVMKCGTEAIWCIAQAAYCMLSVWKFLKCSNSGTNIDTEWNKAILQQQLWFSKENQCITYTCVRGCCKHSRNESSVLQWK